MAKFDRSKFVITKKQSAVFTKSAKGIKKEFTEDFILWDDIKIPAYKEAVCKDTNDFTENILTILPYVITSTNNAWVASGQLPLGAVAYQNRIVRHSGLGKSDSSVLCIRKMYGQKCPACEQAYALYKQNAHVPKYKIPDEYKFLKVSDRDVYLVIPRIGEQAGQLCYYIVSNYIFTQPFEAAKLDYARIETRKIQQAMDRQRQMQAAGQPITGTLVTEADLEIPEFTDPDRGADVRFLINGEKMEKKYSGFMFMPRDLAIEDEVLDRTFDFSEHFKILSYEEIDTMLIESMDMAVGAENGMEVAGSDDDYKLPETKVPVPGITNCTTNIGQSAANGVPNYVAPPATQATTPIAPPVAAPTPTAPEAVTQPADNTSPIAASPCPHNIAVKNSDVRCMQCDPSYKTVCER